MRTKQLGETYLSSVLEMRLKELCDTFKSVLELVLQVLLSSCFIWPCLTCLLQWCSGQWTLPGAPPVTSGAPRPPGARPHTHVAEGSDPGLDRGGGISTGPQVLLTGGHSHTRRGKILFYVWMYSIVHWSWTVIEWNEVFYCLYTILMLWNRVINADMCWSLTG